MISGLYRRWLAAMVLAAAVPATALAQQDGQQIQDWTVRCEQTDAGQRNCLIFQTLADQDNDRPVLQISVGYPNPGGGPAAMLIVPLGVALEPGMRIQVDEEPTIQAPFNHCNRMGCVVGFPMTAELIDAFKRGITSRVTVFDLTGQPISLDVSLRGFTAGFDSISR